jgi:YHS domain-containing protein
MFWLPIPAPFRIPLSNSHSAIMKTLLTLVVFTALSSGISFANTNCPVSGKPVDKAITTSYSKTAALCCNRCKAQFDANPKAWLNALLTANPNQCPMSKKSLTTKVNVTYKRDVAFCSAECKAKFDAAPDKMIKDVR